MKSQNLIYIIRNKLYFLVFINLLIILIGSCTITPKKNTRLNISQRNRLIDSIFLKLVKDEGFTGNIIISENNKITYQNGFGTNNEGRIDSTAILSDFDFSPLSREFIALAIIILKEQKKLELNDDISNHIPELNIYKGTTIRNLLNYTNGISHKINPLDFAFQKIASNSDFISFLAKNEMETVFLPNSRYRFNNINYCLLVYIIEKVSHRTFPEFMQEFVFEPAGMKSASIFNPNIASDGIVGEGKINLNLLDILKFDSILYTNSLAKKETINQMFDSTRFSDGRKHNYGLGWGIDYDKVYGKIVYSGGEFPFYRTWIERHLDTKKIIIILMYSRAHVPIQNLRLLITGLNPRKERKTTSNTLLLNYTGKYKLPNNDTITVFLDHSADLKVKLPTGKTSLLFAEGNTRFFLGEDESTVVEFITDKTGKAFKIIFYRGGKNQNAIRI